VTVAATGSKVTTTCWVVAGAFAGWAAARLAAADRLRRTEFPVVPLLSFTPQVSAAAPWAALGLCLARRRGPAATAALAAAALGLAVRSRGIPRPQPTASGPVLRVLTVNLFHGRGDAETVVALACQVEADVLFLQELTADVVTRLKQAGLADLMPHTRLELRRGSGGSGIYSRFPLGEGRAVAPVRAAQPTALLELPSGDEVELICVHLSAPALRRDGAVRWRAELAVLPPPGRLPMVVAGDFNATIDHAAFRDVLRLGYADAARQAGKALTPTWGPWEKGAMLTLDHVLVDRSCAVLACSVHAIPGSDHRAVYAVIQLPSGN
jgi:endonuclease/exonuclease/phosphatase family metal-dependent hydrolase